jgi:hypothetical protein
MKVILHIGELTLYGFSPAGRHAIGDAVQESLRELIATAPPAGLSALGDVAALRAPPARLGATPATAGHAIAGAVHAALGGARR